MHTITAPQSAAKTSRRRVWSWIAGGAGLLALALLAATGLMFWRMSAIPADLDLSTTRTSAQGLLVGAIRPAVAPIPVNTIHSWTLHLETPDGRPVENAAIVVRGDMPQHGHGLATTPQVSAYLGQGDYLVEGMKFQMNGWWYVAFDITADGKQDTVRFDLVLK